ncbi:unnamed protein product [Fusarium venenatum]|uniref:Uncharacterized protein n=1 Tax=Fusarium venenatum TaxID=56646 RepID=A0A2L2U507_9HYPO|nr:uncharacterized protein FVRRES_10492 [Fusarium venenatum]KAH6967094.1 hypothetical protein EDB82DRAFT_481385 [Fusarium venenatum]CEI70415.1 unnamed protein product [Fusarium venenatum]
MYCRALYFLLIFLGILACLADSSPCIKNTASPCKNKKKGGRFPRCIKQKASHHEVHHHHNGTYTIECGDKPFKPGNHDDKKNKYDKDYRYKDDEDRKEWANRKLHDTYHDSHPLRDDPKQSEMRKVTWRPRTHFNTFNSKSNFHNHIRPTRLGEWRKSKPEKRHARGEVFNPPYPFSMDEVVAMKKVNVTIEQNGKDPIAINVIIRNNSKMNVTIMTRNSPVDKDAFKLGHFRVYPDDTKINFAPEREDYEWYHRPMGMFSRPTDPRKEYLESDLTHLRPNETVKQTIIIPSGTKEENKQWLEMIKLAKKIKMRVEGKWFAIGAWDKEPRWSRSVDFKYVSNTIDLEIPRE